MKSLILISLLFSAGAAQAAKTSKAEVEKFMQEYVRQVAKKDVAKIPSEEGFKPALEDDSDEFGGCTSCKLVLREPVKMKEYDEDEENAPEEDVFEVHMDIFKSGNLLARRSGCYMVMKKNDHLVLKEYQYECTE